MTSAFNRQKLLLVDALPREQGLFNVNNAQLAYYFHETTYEKRLPIS